MAVITRITNGETVDLVKLSVEELRRLHYEEELCYANLIRGSAPFSAERAALMSKGYEVTFEIIRTIADLTGVGSKQLWLFGANNSYVRLAENIVKKVVSEKGCCNFFEAGVGAGLIISAVSKLRGVNVSGCDVFVNKEYIKDHLNVSQGTIYDVLIALKDNSIDVFYWNDVFEHILLDEIDFHIELIRQKLSDRGIIITITPNKLTGPSDITNAFEPKGSASKGFHFCEWTFKEVLAIYKKHNLKSAFGIWLGFIGYKKQTYYVCKFNWFIDKLKIFIEMVIAPFPWILRVSAVVVAACSVSVVRKCRLRNAV